MLPTLRLANARKPLIRFIGKRQWPSKPEEQHPHPFAPPELKQHFADFLKKFQSSSATSSSSATAKNGSATGPVYEEFWQAPARYRKRELEEWEIDLVQSGGASVH
ncbi:hypothetical protein L226DRAFT_79447 [Lentinus tigrinus ALCF2SS1-7]|uniref:Uncharacterized protein n=1 Tax=Lentinus tigrinus ALCF2SS1-6 TaxID=1328759 RepID=A0A5C2SEG0_9APHY|nr:hypothetical protein L227DRAFT_652263 [Lentinus tigrinus ALCF2SS1-6]RPD74629.1 hypothetical protein L226DRAFT_79447 [Lentinus tigrinus ALCF2SS1-7]